MHTRKQQPLLTPRAAAWRGFWRAIAEAADDLERLEKERSAKKMSPDRPVQ